MFDLFKFNLIQFVLVYFRSRTLTMLHSGLKMSAIIFNLFSKLFYKILLKSENYVVYWSRLCIWTCIVRLCNPVWVLKLTDIFTNLCSLICVWSCNAAEQTGALSFILYFSLLHLWWPVELWFLVAKTLSFYTKIYQPIIRHAQFMTYLITKLHSSRMRTPRALTVSPSMLCSVGEFWSGGICSGGCIQHALRQTPPLPGTEFLTHTYENISLPQTSFAAGN